MLKWHVRGRYFGTVLVIKREFVRIVMADLRVAVCPYAIFTMMYQNHWKTYYSFYWLQAKFEISGQFQTSNFACAECDSNNR